MTTLREIIEGFEYDLSEYESPGGYQDAEYYVRCRAKADLLEDVIRTLKDFEKEQK
jgi:hypothetical protein